jgi:hypothetical protein
MSSKALFAIVIAGVFAAIGIRLASAPKTSGTTTTGTVTGSRRPAGIFASFGFSARERQREYRQRSAHFQTSANLQ